MAISASLATATLSRCEKSRFAMAKLDSSSLGWPKPSRKAFGLSNSNLSSLSQGRRSRTSAMAAVHKVKIIGPEGKEAEFEAPDDAYLLDSAEGAGMDLPYSCRAGACSTCAGLMVSGTVDQSDGSFLDEAQKEKGYVLTCISYPTSDCVIYSHKEADLY